MQCECMSGGGDGLKREHFYERGKGGGHSGERPVVRDNPDCAFKDDTLMSYEYRE